MATFTGLPAFDYLQAETAADVFAAVRRKEGCRFLAGGTDLLLQIREGKLSPSAVIDLKELPGMKDLLASREGLVVGGAVTVNQLASHSQVRSVYPLLAEAAISMASYQLRNRATLAGNLCNASPGADMAPALLVYGAGLHLISETGRREIAVEDFFKGPGRTAMQDGEFMQSIHIPLPPNGAVGRYRKLGRNRAGDLAVVGAAVLAYPDDTPSGHAWRIALASVAPTPVRVREAETVLTENAWSREAAVRAAERAAAAARPIDDVRASAAYRRAMVRTQTLQAVQAVHEELERGG